MRALVTCAAFILLLPALAAAQEAVAEIDVKAAMVYNFTKFVEWPAVALSEKEFVFCHSAGDALASALKRATRSRAAQGRPIALRQAEKSADLAGCNALLVGSGEGAKLLQSLSAISRTPILTVGDTRHFAMQGGMIGLVVVDNRVRFEVNLEAVRVAGLTMSSKLLRLAVSRDEVRP